MVTATLCRKDKIFDGERVSEADKKPQLTEFGTVFVPVIDQNRALEFYTGILGFEKGVDFTYGGLHRWVEVAPPNSKVGLAFVPRTEGEATYNDQAYGAFASKDIEADHAFFTSKGVNVDPQIARKGTPRSGLVSTVVKVENPVPAQFFFCDPDGNRFLIVQPD